MVIHWWRYIDSDQSELCCWVIFGAWSASRRQSGRRRRHRL